jgi:hypothetical protein
MDEKHKIWLKICTDGKARPKNHVTKFEEINGHCRYSPSYEFVSSDGIDSWSPIHAIINQMTNTIVAEPERSV